MAIFGDIFLALSLFFAFIQFAIPFYGFKRHNIFSLNSARVFSLCQFFFVILTYGCLTFAFANNDFSITYVAENSHPALPLMYRLTAVWGAHEGSVLLWILLLNCWTIAFGLIEKKNSATQLTIAILGIISFSLLLFLLCTSNPFLITTTNISPNDLNPLLQDPGFVIHPPMLYTGYVGFSVVFAITQAHLILGKLDISWAKCARQFALIAFAFLTLGITLGSWWAYRVLGWGGFWFWDPVENASLLPWLSGTALIHVLLLVEKKLVARRFAALLALITFALSLLGTFLVRSGVLISAHTFANDPSRGAFLLVLITIILFFALLNYVNATYRYPNHALPFSFFSRETGLLINAALLLIAMLTILLGTLYPLILNALHLGSVSVGAPYFNLVLLPLVLLMMFFMGAAQLCQWQSQSIKTFWIKASTHFAISILISVLFIFVFDIEFEMISFLCMTLSIWILLNLSKPFSQFKAVTLAHAGFAMLMLGIILSSLLNQENDVRLKPGDSATLGPYAFHFESTKGTDGGNYRGIRTTFLITKNNHVVTKLYPEKRIYTVRDMVMTKVAIHPGFFRDLYIALGEPLDEDYWSIRLYYKPFVRWIWLGGLLIMISGLLACFQSIKRVTHT